ncbi:hydrolase [Vibrio sp. CAIM 722]|uniref:Hydrolase n=1 Tax=Vibrio eleionomae TaxID=2653505 RepID=A0A7X4RUL1_9VIBR|nr:alpha/beta hydrolase family protein [Vibrio eleionomae]MZI93981.1 hydrolase [Vibrio eleionomae]
MRKLSTLALAIGCFNFLSPLALANTQPSTTTPITTTTKATYDTQEIDSPDRSFPLFYKKLKAHHMPYTMAFHTGLNPVAWHNKALAKAEEIIIPYQANSPFDPVVIDRIDRGSYIAQKVVFNIDDESRVMALMLVPKGKGPFPAALFLHDHGARFDIGKEKFVETWNDPKRLASSKQWAHKYFTDRFPGDELAKHGYVVLSIDALGWGDRSVAGFKTDSQQALASNLYNLGSSFAGIIALDDLRAAKFLANQPYVDKTRVASVGFSMGAFRSWQLAALSPDITAGIVDCWMGTMKGLMVPGNNQLKGQSAFTMLYPFMARYFDYPDVAGIAAPKPMLFYNGGKDTLFPVSSVKEAYGKLHQIWDANHAGDKLVTKVWPSKTHIFTKDMQDSAYAWLDKQFAVKQ